MIITLDMIVKSVEAIEARVTTPLSTMIAAGQLPHDEINYIRNYEGLIQWYTPQLDEFETLAALQARVDALL